ncbi:MAG: Asp-tRNA(Asn)/Glu-tRNA(Gln) amidotransferase GatCAB subunit C [Deltaproteobacteria bacterium]|nr:MAG: Asp-tRNA(Asn)/Glu-tRNA(Gln) amidotransferase GatCAB subunit C [Deltaproteobacteria bacterium]
MVISKDEVLYVAHLARLDIQPEEMNRLSGQIDEILRYVDKLKEADTGNVAPTARPLPLVNRLREDEPGESLGSEAAVKNSCDNYDGMFVVPKVVKQ